MQLNLIHTTLVQSLLISYILAISVSIFQLIYLLLFLIEFSLAEKYFIVSACQSAIDSTWSPLKYTISLVIERKKNKLNLKNNRHKKFYARILKRKQIENEIILYFLAKQTLKVFSYSTQPIIDSIRIHNIVILLLDCFLVVFHSVVVIFIVDILQVIKYLALS